MKGRTPTSPSRGQNQVGEQKKVSQNPHNGESPSKAPKSSKPEKGKGTKSPQRRVLQNRFNGESPSKAPQKGKPPQPSPEKRKGSRIPATASKPESGQRRVGERRPAKIRSTGSL